MGISKEGEKVEQAFRDFTGARKPERRVDGDAILDDTFIEVKKVSSRTVNQVRAVRFIPLVCCKVEPTRQWYVVAAHEVVRLVAAKERGQHTANPFESTTLSLGKLGSSVSDEDLLSRVRQAINDDKNCPKLEAEMKQVRAKCEKLAKLSLKRVRAILKKPGSVGQARPAS